MTTEIDARRKKKKKEDEDKSFRGDARRQQMLEQGITRPGGSGSGRHRDRSKYRRKPKHKKRDYAAFDAGDFDLTSYSKPGVQRKPYEKNTEKKRQQKGQEKWDDKRFYRQNRTQILRQQARYREYRKSQLRQRRRGGRHWKYPWMRKKSYELENLSIPVMLMQPTAGLSNFSRGDLAVITYIDLDDGFVQGYIDMEGFDPMGFKMSLLDAVNYFLWEDEDDLNRILDLCVEKECGYEEVLTKKITAATLQQPFTVAAIQHHPKFLDPAFNIWELSALVMRAALLNKAKVIVLPELCTTGYTMDKVEAGSVSEPISLRGRTVKAFAGLSKKLGVYIAFGMVEHGGEDKEGLPIFYNSQVMVGPEGTILGIYRKQNLWGSDWMWATRGPLGKPPIIETPYGRLGLLICKDVRDKNPAGQELYKTGDADIVCLSTNWGNGEFPSGVWMSFTKQNQCWLVISNRWGGPEKHNNFDGGSAIISPTGEVFTFGLEIRSNCIVTQEIDPGKF